MKSLMSAGMLASTLALFLAGAATTAAATMATVTTTAATLPADGATLDVGSVAPKLTDVQWLQGDAASDWKSGDIYVLDFWATWCPPCRESIPHVNALSRAFEGKNVHVIGVAIWPRAGMVPTADFVKQKGTGMSYAIAEDIGGKTAEAFMSAAGRNGIPTVMVVDGEGKVAWIGHPMNGLSAQLGTMVPGFDAVAFDKERVEREASYKRLVAAMQQAEKDKDWAAFASASSGVIALDPAKNGQFAIYGYQALLKLEDKTNAKAYGREAIAGALKDQAEPLNLFAWAIVDPDSELPMAERDLELADLAVKRADELSSHKDPSVLDTLARVQFLNGAVQDAVATQKQAVELAPDADMRKDLQSRLDEYLKGAPKG